MYTGLTGKSGELYDQLITSPKPLWNIKNFISYKLLYTEITFFFTNNLYLMGDWQKDLQGKSLKLSSIHK